MLCQLVTPSKLHDLQGYNICTHWASVGNLKYGHAYLAQQCMAIQVLQKGVQAPCEASMCFHPWAKTAFAAAEILDTHSTTDLE